MQEFNPLSATVGGVLIGISATLLLLLNGRIAGISGIVGGVLTARSQDVLWRWLFLISLFLGAALYRVIAGDTELLPDRFAPILMIVGGLLVGYGTRLGGGCTSGHGVCGLGRLSARSLVATLCFVASAMVTVFLVRHVLEISL
ncbi:MAG: YeeE/YedE family protein [Gammaproteobacteria bacterium]|nr:YeeE/YedE family protein [Gammaproteobacteria bacterium]